MVGAPVWPNGVTLAAEAAFTVTAEAASAAAPVSILRRSRPPRKVSGLVMVFPPTVFVVGMEIVSPHSGTMRAGDAVSRVRCGILHAASQNRDPGFFECKQAGPRLCSAPLRKSYVLRWVRGTRSNRIPVENIRGAVELVERRFQRRHAMAGDRLRRP